MHDPESRRLADEASKKGDWKRWGTYLPERQWGTVREDYSAKGKSWEYFSYEDAVSRTFRWGEDGLLGWADRKCRLGFSIALWNGKDPILKERLFGLTNPEGNHGEDVKELYYYLDATPTHSYCRGLYKYPIDLFPYRRLREENARRGFEDPEFDLIDTGLFEEGKYFDVFVEYAKSGPNDSLIRVRIVNRSDDFAELTFLGQLIFRNTWAWGCKHEGCTGRPSMFLLGERNAVRLAHETLGQFSFWADPRNCETEAEWLFTENESNLRELFGTRNEVDFTKDAFHRYVIQGELERVKTTGEGTKCAGLYRLSLPPGSEEVLQFRLAQDLDPNVEPFGPLFSETFVTRIEEMEAFYGARFPEIKDPEEKKVHRQAMAGLLWTKQFYHYSVYDWLEGDPEVSPPPPGREKIRNYDWQHMFCRDILSMPDKWEYPWFAAWDTAFHMIPFAEIDPWFTRDQLLLFLREWYLHPNGQIPAYEFNFSDVNPPVHAWACREVYRSLGRQGLRDLDFLEQAFHKLLLNFTWWVNRKDPEGKHVFSGGFLGLDNIGPFDRSHPPAGMEAVEQADGTAWVAFNCAVMLDIALELASHRPVYAGIASKFFEHFMSIADAMNYLGGEGLWDEEDGFYYDHFRYGGKANHFPIRSMVGLIPLFAVLVLDDDLIDRLAGFRKRVDWFLAYRRDVVQSISWKADKEGKGRHLLAIPSRERLERVLRYVFDEEEFLSPFGIRSLSRFHEEHPFEMQFGGSTHRVSYLPGESDSGMFGGNSNWRGPIWFPVNYLLIESLRTYHRFYGSSFKVEVPTGSGRKMNLAEAADEISRRLKGIFLRGKPNRPCHGDQEAYETDPGFRDLILFYEYFHADTGRGCGASHQTGWTALIASLMGTD